MTKKINAGLYFITREQHPPKYQKRFRAFADDPEQLEKNVGRRQDSVIAAVVSIHGVPLGTPHGYFLIHTTLVKPKKRRAWHKDLAECQAVANEHVERYGACFIVAQVVRRFVDGEKAAA